MFFDSFVKFVCYSPQVIAASVDAALLLFTRLTAKLTKYVFLEVLLMSMDIILGCLTKLKSTQPDTSDDKVKEVLEKAAPILKEWVVKKDVIGGSLFGGKVNNGFQLHELKVLFILLLVDMVKNKNPIQIIKFGVQMEM